MRGESVDWTDSQIHFLSSEMEKQEEEEKKEMKVSARMRILLTAQGEGERRRRRRVKTPVQRMTDEVVVVYVKIHQSTLSVKAKPGDKRRQEEEK